MSKTILKSKNNRIEEVWEAQQEYKKFHFLPTDKRACILVFAFIIADFCFIRQLVDYYFYDTALMAVLSSAVIAVIIDVTPTTIASCIMIKSKQLIHYIVMAMATAMLVAAFGILGYARLHSADLIFSIGNTSLISSANNAANAIGITKGQEAMSWLFVMMPVFTSILSFGLGIVCDNGSEKEYVDKLAGASFFEGIKEKEAKIIELKHVMNSNFDESVDAKYELALSNNRAQEQIVYDKLKLMQACACGSQEAADVVLTSRIGKEEA